MHRLRAVLYEDEDLCDEGQDAQQAPCSLPETEGIAGIPSAKVRGEREECENCLCYAGGYMLYMLYTHCCCCCFHLSYHRSLLRVIAHTRMQIYCMTQSEYRR